MAQVWVLVAPGALQAGEGCGGPPASPWCQTALRAWGTVASCVTSQLQGEGGQERRGQVPSDVETLSSLWKPVSGTL